MYVYVYVYVYVCICICICICICMRTCIRIRICICLPVLVQLAQGRLEVGDHRHLVGRRLHADPQEVVGLHNGHGLVLVGLCLRELQVAPLRDERDEGFHVAPEVHPLRVLRHPVLPAVLREVRIEVARPAHHAAPDVEVGGAALPEGRHGKLRTEDVLWEVAKAKEVDVDVDLHRLLGLQHADGPPRALERHGPALHLGRLVIEGVAQSHEDARPVLPRPLEAAVGSEGGAGGLVQSIPPRRSMVCSI